MSPGQAQDTQPPRRRLFLLLCLWVRWFLRSCPCAATWTSAVSCIARLSCNFTRGEEGAREKCRRRHVVPRVSAAPKAPQWDCGHDHLAGVVLASISPRRDCRPPRPACAPRRKAPVHSRLPGWAVLFQCLGDGLPVGTPVLSLPPPHHPIRPQQGLGGTHIIFMWTVCKVLSYGMDRADRTSPVSGAPPGGSRVTWVRPPSFPVL